MDDIYDDINDYNKKRKRKVLVVFDDMIPHVMSNNKAQQVFDDMIPHIMSNKKAQQVLKELFIRCRKLNISLCFLTQSYSNVPKHVRLNCTHYVIFKLNNIRGLQNIAINYSADIDYKDFFKIYRDTTQPIDKRFRKNFNDPL